MPTKTPKPTVHQRSSCAVVRTILVTHGTIRFGTGEYTEHEKRWETKPCGGPLFGDDERRSGVCRSCARGWNHPNDYRADGPRPTEETEET